MSKIETRFLVPLHEDISYGGALNPHNRWQNLERDLFRLFSGWTLSSGLYLGEYPDPDTGRPIRDKSKQYIIALEEERIPELREYLKKVAVIFGQKVIYFFNGREVEFVESAERTL